MKKYMGNESVDVVKKKIKQEQGSITLYVLISMMFFLVIISGIYFNSSNKIQKQEKEIEKIQKEYEKNNINDIYEEVYNNYANAETPTIQVYDGDTLKNEVIGEKVSSKKNVYLANETVTLKFLSKNASDKYAYSTTPNGEKTEIEGNTLDIDITTSGKTIYVYIEDSEGNYSEYYTAVTLILVTFKDKTIYVEEGKETQIGEIEGENAEYITFGQVEDNTIIKLDGDTVTGLKAGTTTLIATEEKSGATAIITVKVVKIELAITSGTILAGDSRTVKITGTNNGTLSVKSNDEQISTASINNDEIIITAKKAGNATITVTESNVKATATYKIKVVSVALTPNGGTYTMPTEGNATIKTTVVTENTEKIEVAWSDNAGEWSVIENNKLVEKINCTSGTYYLYVRINEETIYKSKEFIVEENTLESNKITITPSTTNMTNEDVTATITYGSTLTANKKAGYGSTLSNAKTAASTSTATILTATANGYFYAEATDEAGNIVSASLQITNIDKTAPAISLTASTTDWTNEDVTLTGKSQDTESGIVAYAWTTSEALPTSWDSITQTTSEIIQTIELTSNETRYFWTKDECGNINSVSYTVNIIDKNVPNTPTIYNPTNENWTNTSFSLTLSSTDNGESGIAFYQYSYDASEWVTYGSSSTADGGSFTTTPFSQERNQLAYIRACDKAGNYSEVASTMIKIDYSKPDTPTIYNPTGEKWTNTQFSLTLSSTDNGGSGIAFYQYSYDASEWVTYGNSSTADGGSFVTTPFHAERNQLVYIRACDKAGNYSEVASTMIKLSYSYNVEEGLYNIVSSADTSKCLDVASFGTDDGTNVFLWTKNGLENQKFEFVYLGDGYYKIKTFAEGKVLDVTNGSSESGANLQQYTWNESSAQKWKFYLRDEGWYYIQSQLGTVIDLQDGNTSEGANIQLWEMVGGTSQWWYLEKIN